LYFADGYKQDIIMIGSSLPKEMTGQFRPKDGGWSKALLLMVAVQWKIQQKPDCPCRRKKEGSNN
jgi:hypothetical protein